MQPTAIQLKLPAFTLGKNILLQYALSLLFYGIEDQSAVSHGLHHQAMQSLLTNEIKTGTS